MKNKITLQLWIKTYTVWAKEKHFHILHVKIISGSVAYVGVTASRQGHPEMNMEFKATIPY